MVECVGTYQGLPIYTDPNMDRDRILTLNKSGGKPPRVYQARNPRTKGLDHGQIQAFIMHPETADKLKQAIYNGG